MDFVSEKIKEGSVIVKGKGYPVLFLHGYLSSKESFYYQTEALSKKFKVVAVDLPGFGKAGEPPFAYSLGDYVDYVSDITDSFCGGEAMILAHSFGGRIAIKLAAERPEKVKAMLLVGCAGIRPKRAIKKTFSIYSYKLLKKTNAWLAAKWEEKHSSPDYLALSPLMRESFKKIINEHLDDTAKKVSAPTLLVFGDKDNETPLYMAKKLEKNITSSGLVIMKGYGHFCFSENPYAFNEIASVFFSEEIKRGVCHADGSVERRLNIIE